MKTSLPVTVFAFVTVLSLSCSALQNAADGLATSLPSSAGVSTTGSLKAKATSPISVQLSWGTVTGATKYSVELQLGDLDPFVLAEVPGAATSYEDFPAPPNTDLTYRVSSVTSSGTTEVGTAKLTTAEEVPNPLAVKVNYEENRFVIPTLDPNRDPRTYNPSDFLPPGFDPENPDLSLLQPGPKTVYQDIGPEGGTMEATGSTGVKYTLTVPPDAVDLEIPFGLTPVQSIDGFPLSGGMTGGVEVSPVGIEFNEPLLLTISPPEGVAALPEGMVEIGFAVTPVFEGNEFYFVPHVVETSASLAGMGGGRLARPSASPAKAGPAGGGIAVRDGGVYGEGRGTRGEIRETVTEHPSSSSTNRAKGKRAAEQASEEELAPMPDKAGQSILMDTEFTYTPDRFMQTLTDFQAYLDAGGGSLAEAIWEQMVIKASSLFDNLRKECLTKDNFVAQGTAARMSDPKGSFWTSFRDRYVKKYGKENLQKATELSAKCKLGLRVDSKITWKVEGITQFYDVTILVSPLSIRYASGDVSLKSGLYLDGYGKVVFNKPVDSKIKDCLFTRLEPGNKEFIRIAFKPIFDEKGNLANFEVVDFGGGGGTGKLTQYCHKGDDVSVRQINSPQGGVWGGIYVNARGGDVTFSGFSVSSPPPSSGVVAQKEFSGPTHGVSGEVTAETTVFKLIMGSAGK